MMLTAPFWTLTRRAQPTLGNACHLRRLWVLVSGTGNYHHHQRAPAHSDLCRAESPLNSVKLKHQRRTKMSTTTDTVPVPPETARASVCFNYVYADIDAPIDNVWDILTDVSKYHEWCVGSPTFPACSSN